MGFWHDLPSLHSAVAVIHRLRWIIGNIRHLRKIAWWKSIKSKKRFFKSDWHYPLAKVWFMNEILTIEVPKVKIRQFFKRRFWSLDLRFHTRWRFLVMFRVSKKRNYQELHSVNNSFAEFLVSWLVPRKNDQ